MGRTLGRGTVVAVTGRVVLFGATGFTGRLTAEAMTRAGLAPVLAGRSPDALVDLTGEPRRARADGRPADLAGGRRRRARVRARPRHQPARRARLDRRAVHEPRPPRARRRRRAGLRLRRLHRRGPVHPRGLRAARRPRPRHGGPAADGLRLRLRAREPRRRTGHPRGPRARSDPGLRAGGVLHPGRRWR